jgi:hypothetical protein
MLNANSLYCADIVEANPPAPAQLLVLDVFVPIPRGKPSMLGVKVPNLSSASGDVGDRGPVASATTATIVDIHQTVGLFPCHQDKCPANLDCGLFEFDHFYNLFKQQSMTTGSSKLKSGYSEQSSKSQSVGSLIWNNPDPSSGSIFV